MENPRLHLARQFVLHTANNLFLTGKAGTGKTTFLRNVLKETRKKYLIAAPTGVAAINAGGVTIHSLFGLPLTAFTPDDLHTDPNLATNRGELLRHLRYNREKRQLLQELDLLVIDEISMVRADLLDAIDFALRKVRRRESPFGEVQILAIGDLFQLSPVINPSVWNILQVYYATPYFFDARSWKSSKAVTIELTHVYRQKNQQFIDLLNRMRYGKTTLQDIDLLNARCLPDFDPGNKKYITLTTHNAKANRINSEKMEALPGKAFTYKALIEDVFPENAYPVDSELILKVGAQVMFTRNDPEGRFFNGKIAEVSQLTSKKITVRFENGETLEVDEIKWENKIFELNEETREISPKIIGSFTQFPLRLAWAITVHKSQGLTFDHMIADLGNTFATGQAYVALSRCTSLDGLVLLGKMNNHNVMVDHQIVEYHDIGPDEKNLLQVLEEGKMQFAVAELKSAFDFLKLSPPLDEWQEWLDKKEIPNAKKIADHIKHLEKSLIDWFRISRNFQSELHNLLHRYRESKDIGKIRERINKAIPYFTTLIFENLIKPLDDHKSEILHKSKLKKYVRFLEAYERTIWEIIERLYSVSFLGESLFMEERKYRRESLGNSSKPAQKVTKGATYEETLSLFQKGKTVEDIAAIRGLVAGTIYSHLSKLIGEGKVSIEKLIPLEKKDQIISIIEKNDHLGLAALKEMIPFDIEFHELRMVKNHFEFLKKQQESK